MGFVSEDNFDYLHLDSQTRTIIRQRTSEIKDLMRLTAENIINIGQKLTEVKEQLGHGSFQNWLRSEFEWSEQTARQFMQVYRWSETIENKNFVFSQLATSALYLLAAPSTPIKAREEVLGLVGGDDKVSYTRVKNIVDRYKQQPSNNPEVIDIDVRAEDETKTEYNKTRNLLFRLETSQLGRIVRLYRAEELEIISDLTIGAIVKIKIGRWQNQTAKIIEVLNEQQFTTLDRKLTNQTAENEICVRAIDEIDFSNPKKLQEIGQSLILSYGNISLTIAGSPEILNAFVKRIETDSAFVKNMLERAMDGSKQ